MELVKYHNDINSIRTGSFTEKEIDIFFSILFKLKNKKEETTILTFAELKGLANNTQNNSRLINQIKNMSRKLLNLNQEIELPTGEIMLFNLFRTLKIDPSNRELTISINQDFLYMLNDLIGNYTKFDLKALVSLKSGYSKQLFKLLKQYEGRGPCSWYWVELEEFRELLGVPEGYQTRHFNDRVLKPIEKDLGSIFKNFEIIKLTKDGQQVGRGKRTHSLKFTWEKEEKGQEVAKKELPKVEPIKYRYGAEAPQKPEESQESIKNEELEDYKAEILELAKQQIKENRTFKIFNVVIRAANKKENIDKMVFEYGISKKLPGTKGETPEVKELKQGI